VTLVDQAIHDTSVTFDLAVPASPDGLLVGAVLRQGADGSAYVCGLRFGLDGSVSTEIDRYEATGLHLVATPVVLTDVGATPGAILRLRADVTGTDPATISVRVWPQAAAEPHVWRQSVVDWTGALQGDGTAGIAFAAVLDSDAQASPPVVVTVDNFQMSTADTPENE
jgi:hypothetical protein